MPFQITKEFSLCYGHRVHNQVLQKDFADNLKCACRHLHGHEGKVEVTLTTLDSRDGLTNGMVTDFRHMEVLKRFINATLDHRFLIDAKDPMLTGMLTAAKSFIATPEVYDIKTIEINGLPVAGELTIPEGTPEVDRDYLESFVVVNFVPTSENLSRWLFTVASHVMKPLARVVSVDWWETPKSHSLYVGG